MKSDDDLSFDFISMCKFLECYVFIILLDAYVNCYSISNDLLTETIFFHLTMW